jgi:hypothetical protein
MVLAAIDPLVFEEVQLLADSFGPLFVIEMPMIAETLILRGLMLAFPAVHRTRTCFLLAVTEMGRSYVETWVGKHGKHRYRKAKRRKAA